MSDKKHIDRLFQERFKDFEATPSDAVWQNIEAELNKKKKKRRIIPMWWRYAGIAALLVLLLTIGGLFLNSSDSIEHNQVVDTKNETLDDSNEKNNSTLIDSNKKETTTNNTVIAETNTEKESLETPTQTQDNKASDNVIPLNQTAVAENSASKHKNNGAQKTLLSSNKKSNTFNVAIVKTDNTTVVASNTKEKTNTVIQNKNDEPQIDIHKANEIINPATKNNTAITKAKEDDISTDPITKTEVVADNNTKENTLTIEEALNEAENNIKEEDENLNRWSITPNAAPVYFSSLGDGSSIGPQFNNNSKSSELNMSYGIKASYAVNKKLSIRTGINKVNLGYNTNNVVVFQAISSRSSALQNVNITNDGATDAVSIISGNNLSSSKNPEVFAKSSNTSINQNMGYIEVPLEIQYALINKKFGVNVIGGFSSLFLNKNEIFSENTGSKTFLGEANNINNVSYSANFGVGLNYKVSKKIDLNFEPMFKYQINTFNNTSGNFKPYFIGVYTGFAIKF